MPTGVYYRPPAWLRVLNKSLIGDGCWEFQGSTNEHGHGAIGVVVDGKKTHRKAHRVLYEHMRGPVPDGMELDHTCLKPSCVNPDHLEPVTHTENIRRGYRWSRELGRGRYTKGAGSTGVGPAPEVSP